MKRARFRLFCSRRLPADCRSALRDDDIFEACLEEATEQYQRSCTGKLQEWLEWLMEHADEIIALVQKIIRLFAV